MAPPLRLCGVQRCARPLAFRGSPISWSTGTAHSDPSPDVSAISTDMPADFRVRGGVRGHSRRLTDSGRPRACRGPGGRWRGTTREHSTERSPTLDRAPPPTTHRTTKHRQKIEQESYDPAPANLDTAAASQVLKSPSIYLQDLPAQRRLTQQD
ncbi:hypothetical protein BJV77DRAFT_1018483 [Russula vinacea]|nr:hypothetical protein BJV77DRAFT_1018483 [Russula vinacea]